MFPRHNIVGKAKAQEGLETKHHEFAFELFTEKTNGRDHNLHVVLHPKENTCTYALNAFMQFKMPFFNALNVF